MQQDLDLDKATELPCSKCGNDFFIIKYKLMNLSALVSPTGQDTIIPIQLFACDKCGHVDQQFLP